MRVGIGFCVFSKRESHLDTLTSRHLVISTLLDLNYPPLTLRECDRVLDDVFGAAVVDTGSRCIMDTMGEQFSDCIEHPAVG
jgi:hypothetical protein